MFLQVVLVCAVLLIIRLTKSIYLPRYYCNHDNESMTVKVHYSAGLRVRTIRWMVRRLESVGAGDLQQTVWRLDSLNVRSMGGVALQGDRERAALQGDPCRHRGLAYSGNERQLASEATTGLREHWRPRRRCWLHLLRWLGDKQTAAGGNGGRDWSTGDWKSSRVWKSWSSNFGMIHSS